MRTAATVIHAGVVDFVYVVGLSPAVMVRSGMGKDGYHFVRESQSPISDTTFHHNRQSTFCNMLSTPSRLHHQHLIEAAEVSRCINNKI